MVIRDAILRQNPCHDVREAASGAEVLAYLRRCGRDDGAPRPQLVCLDVDMPDMSARELLRRIRTDPRLENVPVVVLSDLSRDGQEDGQEAAAVRNKASRRASKPIDPVALLRTVLQATESWASVHQLPGGRYAQSA